LTVRFIAIELAHRNKQLGVTEMNNEWQITVYRRGLTVERGNKSEALTNDGSNQIAFDSTRRDCFFVRREDAQKTIDNYNAT
jgi:hypothetical protein